MNQDDLIIAREVRRLLEKHPIDLRTCIVTHNRGWISVSGHVRALRSQPRVSVKEELAIFETQAMRNFSNLKGIIIDARIVETPKKEVPFERKQPLHGPTPAAPTRHE